jgi:ribosome silencing factor RsfS/YbeB/iojap
VASLSALSPQNASLSMTATPLQAAGTCLPRQRGRHASPGCSQPGAASSAQSQESYRRTRCSVAPFTTGAVTHKQLQRRVTCFSSRQDAAKRAKLFSPEDERPNAPVTGPFPLRDADTLTDFSAVDENDSQALAIALAAAAHDVKAVDIQVLDVSRVVSWCRYFVVATAFSNPQVSAAVSKILDAARAEPHGRSLGIEPETSSWVCCDFGDVVAHVFTPGDRQYYDLNGLCVSLLPVTRPFSSVLTPSPPTGTQKPRLCRCHSCQARAHECVLCVCYVSTR